MVTEWRLSESHEVFTSLRGKLKVWSPKESKEELHFKKKVVHGKKSKGEQNNDLWLCRYLIYRKKKQSKCKDKGEKETDHHYFSNGIVVNFNQAQNNLNFIKLNEGIKSFVLIFVGKYQKVRW